MIGYWNVIEAALTSLPESNKLRAPALASFDRLKERVTPYRSVGRGSSRVTDERTDLRGIRGVSVDPVNVQPTSNPPKPGGPSRVTDSAAHTPDVDTLAETVREGLQTGRADSELLSGREFNATVWDDRDAALADLAATARRVAELEAALGDLIAYAPLPDTIRWNKLNSGYRLALIRARALARAGGGA